MTRIARYVVIAAVLVTGTATLTLTAQPKPPAGRASTSSS
jgi:hypothetical protein